VAYAEVQGAPVLLNEYDILMKNLLRIFLIAAACMWASSCVKRVESHFVALPFVDDLLADSLSTLKTYAGLSGKTSGTISLIGDPAECLKVSEDLMTSDRFDNVDGRRASDGLPDFAGETIVSILDIYNAPFDSIIFKRDSVALREISVRDCVYALDTSFSFTPYGGRASISKGSPKVLVICSPLVTECALPDIVDFLSKIGCQIPIISSRDTLFSYSDSLYTLLRKKNMFTHNIAYPSAEGYVVVPEDDSPMSLNSVLVSFDEGFIPTEYPDSVSIWSVAPKTVESYVQK
jgi:hypothetical protein